jgi:hypothetical protein
MSELSNLVEEEYRSPPTSLPALKIAVRQMYELHKLMDSELHRLMVIVNAYEQEHRDGR